MDSSISTPVISLNCKKADERYSKFLLRKYFNCWCDYTVIVNKKKALLEKSIQFYNLHCLKKCIMNWKMYVMLQKQKKDKIDEAQKFYRKRILQKYLNTWINICELTVRKDKMECAIMHHKNKLSVKYFSAWKMYHENKAKKLILKERISMHSRKRLLKRYFELFIVRVNESIADKIAIENAEIFYNSKLMRKVLFAWREWCSKKMQIALKINEIKNILENKIKRRTFVNWRLYVFGKKCKKRKLIAIRNFYEKKILSKALRNFHSYTAYRKEKRIRLSYLSDKSEAITQQLQIVYIEKWRRALYSVMQEKPKLNHAIKFMESNLIRKYFFNWKEFSRQYKIKMARKEKLNEIANSFLVKKFISHWRSKLQDILDLREKEIQAISMMEKKITKKCFSSWKEYIAQKVKKNNDIEAAMELHNKFLLREGLKELLRNSLHNIDYEHDMQLENVAMRLYRNFEILKEYFDKWHSLIYFKNKSKFPCKATKNDEFEFIETRNSCNDIFDSLKTRSVLPEYMMEKDTVSNIYDSIVNTKFPQGSWSFNLFQPF
ncbi:unnamed protein product [Xylocopa violacea]|uniref:Sfi1 spindle body domain-containing protein n=1 Tax=Xylocopa violacea TaxID=135666 RepID=A0ABP1NFM6_XYLVO